jgi:hypothetical protein
MCPLASLALPRPFPLYAAFPRSEYCGQVRLPPQRLLPYGWSIQSAYSVRLRSPRPRWISQVPRYFRFRACRALRPRRSLQRLAFYGRLLLPSRYSTLSACGSRITRLNRFTCVTACPSLCLRLTHLVASMSPRLDSRWGGSLPLPRRELHPLEAPGLSWRTEIFSNIYFDHPITTLDHHPFAQDL